MRKAVPEYGRQCDKRCSNGRVASDEDRYAAMLDPLAAVVQYLPALRAGSVVQTGGAAAEKTRCLAFGRFAQSDARKRGAKPAEFTFLGLTHYCGKTKQGYFKVKRCTSRKKLGAALRAFSDWARRARHKLTKREMLRRAKSRVEGHLNDYAITDNVQACGRFVYFATRILRKWLNRKSQHKAHNWDQYSHALAAGRWPRARILKDLNPYRRAEAS
jgi:RNA-directed DNA polymerase